jgi:hypothetical protein
MVAERIHKLERKFSMSSMEQVEQHLRKIDEALGQIGGLLNRVEGRWEVNPVRFAPNIAAGAIAVNREVKAALRLLRPLAVPRFEKVRLGSSHDGGYICIDDFHGIDTAFSFGIEQNPSWDVAVADRGLTVYQFDHTVDAPLPSDPRMVFAKKRITPDAGDDSESITSLVQRYDKGGHRPNLILKMDIESDEWQVFDATSSSILGRFSQIICEFHSFEDFHDSDWRQRTTRVLRKLVDSHGVVHIHANNFAGSTNIANVFVPNVMEVTFANKDLYTFTTTDEIFPGPLDEPCNPEQPDVHLGSFRF